MVARYGCLVIMALVLSLTACKNRFETYEPYSAFDERMAMSERPSFVPDDQMPVGVSDPYQTQDYPSNVSANRASSAPRHVSEDTEVSFDDSRGQEKHPANVGAL